ncbi:MAG: sugar phosphate isomerase/epimerase [Gemmataceae bacterium]|nr:sugar phosphate isomerase/epimerase [Gemmataceae bacterium]
MSLNRRELLGASLVGVGATVLPAIAKEQKPEKPSWKFCLNTSTIRGQKLTLEQEVKLAAKAGYQGIEPWINELRTFKESGGNLKDLGKLISDSGLSVESGIGFAQWIVDDETTRMKGLDEAKRDMEMLLAIGGKRIAAPPAGATNQTNLDLNKAADRYHLLAETGAKIGIIPMVEVWGFSKSLSRLGETLLVAMESGHPKASILPDIYHLYKGGSGFEGLKMIRGNSIGIFHMNDYPKIERGTIADKDRVYPGDGIAPLKAVLNTLKEIGYTGMFSLELFNPEYWKQDPFEVIKTGLEKMTRLTSEL